MSGRKLKVTGLTRVILSGTFCRHAVGADEQRMRIQIYFRF